MKVSNLTSVLFAASMLIAPQIFAATYTEDGLRLGGAAFKDAQGVRLGSATLKSDVYTEGQYDSNIFLTSNNKKSDYINVTGAKMLLDIPVGIDERHLVQFMYGIDGGSYADHKGENFVNQNLAGNVNLRLPFGYFNVNDDLKDTVDRASTEFTTPVHRTENKASTTIGVEINKLTYELAYSDLIKRYYDKAYSGIEYNEDVFSGTAYYMVFPKTQALLEYDHGIVNYTKGNARDSVYDQVMTGLRGELTGKTLGIAKVGYQLRDYDSAGYSGYSGFVSELGLITNFTDRTQMTLKYRTTTQESFFNNNYFYNANIASVQINQKLTQRFSLLLDSDFARNRYPETDTATQIKRQDSVVGEGIALQYHLKEWWTASLGYAYKATISNIDDRAYNDNIVSLRLDLMV